MQEEMLQKVPPQDKGYVYAREFTDPYLLDEEIRVGRIFSIRRIFLALCLGTCLQRHWMIWTQHNSGPGLAY
jgi:hypothetical protein